MSELGSTAACKFDSHSKENKYCTQLVAPAPFSRPAARTRVITSANETAPSTESSMPARDRSADQEDMVGGDTVEVDKDDDGVDAVAVVAVMAMMAAAISAIIRMVGMDADEDDAGMITAETLV